MFIELEVNGTILYSSNTTTYSKNHQQDSVIMHMKALVRSKCRNEPWAIFIRRRSKMNMLCKDYILNDANLIK